MPTMHVPRTPRAPVYLPLRPALSPGNDNTLHYYRHRHQDHPCWRKILWPSSVHPPTRRLLSSNPASSSSFNITPRSMLSAEPGTEGICRGVARDRPSPPLAAAWAPPLRLRCPCCSRPRGTRPPTVDRRTTTAATPTRQRQGQWFCMGPGAAADRWRGSSKWALGRWSCTEAAEGAGRAEDPAACRGAALLPGFMRSADVNANMWHLVGESGGRGEWCCSVCSLAVSTWEGQGGGGCRVLLVVSMNERLA